MQKLDIQDHDTYWEDDPDMREKTRDYMEWAMQVINNPDNQIFGTGIRHPWQEYGFDIDSNISIFELEGDHRDKPPLQFGDAKDMLMYWENTPKDGTAEKVNRRVILVQDMHPRIIELLGVLLDIPPHFFLAHCDGFVDLSIVDGAFAKKNSSTYWKVALPRWRATPSTIPPGQYYLEAGNFSRQELHKKAQTSYITLKSLVSYWGKSYEPNSWTAVILIDPFKTYVRPKSPDSSDGPARYELPEIKFTREFVQEVLYTGIRSDAAQSSRRSTFDAAVATYGAELDALQHTKDPFTGTAYIRNIIRSTWESFVVRRSREVHDLIFDDQVEHATAFSRGRPKMFPRDTDILVSYQDLMEKRQLIQDEKNLVNAIMWEFRCRDTIPPPKQSDDQESIDEQERIRDSLEQERKSWAMIYEELSRAESMIVDHMEMWSQRATLEQTAAANRLARTSGQLTKIATIIVPCSFVASIFSMGGSFAAGEEYFFVYWTISIPVTAALLAWVLYRDIQDVYERIREMELLRRAQRFRFRRNVVEDSEKKA